MKQLLLLILSLLCLAGGARSATLSGTVFDTGSCAPAAGIKVYARDSNYAMIDSAVTNSAGFYSINLPSTLYPTNGGIIHVNSPFVGGWTVYKPGLDAYCNLVTAPGAAPYGIIDCYGFLGSSKNIKAAKVWLIRREVDPITRDTTLRAIDSSLYATRFDTSYPFPTMCRFLLACWSASDRFLVKMALLPSDPNYASYLPTYSDSVLNWNAMTPISLSSSGGASASIYMKQGTNPGGPGFIGGSVLLGANKGAAVGDPLSHRVLFLTTATGQAVGYTYSDAAGKFSFSNLAPGTYKVFGDVAGKANPAMMVTLTQGNTSVNDIVFEENSKKFEGHLQTAGISGTSKLAGISVYPNPAKDILRVQGLDACQGLKTLVLSNLAGQEVGRKQVESGDGQISMAALPAGIYILSVHTQAGSAYLRVVK